MGMQNKVKELQEKVGIIAEALTRSLKQIKSLEALTKGTLTAFQLHIGEDEWKKVVDELKDLESRPQPEEKKFENVE